MKTVTATEAKQELWNIMSDALQSPIKITKRNRDYVYILSAEEYDGLKALEVYEDLVLWKMAEKALDGWLASEEDTNSFLTRFGIWK